MNGVITTAARLEIAVMLTEVATLARPIQVITLEKLPPGQQDTRIMPSARPGLISSAQVAAQVIAGNNMNWATSPVTGATGRRNTLEKSLGRSPRETPNIMNANTAFSATSATGDIWKLSMEAARAVFTASAPAWLEIALFMENYGRPQWAASAAVAEKPPVSTSE